jgi:amidase
MASVALDLSDPSYIAAKNEALVSTKAAVMALFAKYQLDAIVYPTSPRPAQYIKPDGLPRTDRLADEPRQRERLSGFDCARWHDMVRSARDDFVLRAGV